jgi:UDP-N-acetylmuramate dehydrogenase
VIKHNDDIVLRVYLELGKGDPEALKAELADKVAARKESQPLNAGSAGCVFKNYNIESEEELEELKTKLNIPEAMQKNMRISAGWLVDQMDMKGKQIGDAQISEEHGNFVINHGKATASDVVQLISAVKLEARKRYGIQLHEEVQYIGF